MLASRPRARCPGRARRIPPYRWIGPSCSSRDPASRPPTGRLSEVLAALSVVLDAAERRPPRATPCAPRTWPGAIAASCRCRMTSVVADLVLRRCSATSAPSGPITDGSTTDAVAARAPATRAVRRRHDRVHLSRPLRAPAAVVATLGLPASIAETVVEQRTSAGTDVARPRTRGDQISRDGRAAGARRARRRAGSAPRPADIDRAVRAERGRSLDPGLVDERAALGRAGLWAELADTSLFDRPARARAQRPRPLAARRPPRRDRGDLRRHRRHAHAPDGPARSAGRRVRRAHRSRSSGSTHRSWSDLRRAALLHDIGQAAGAHRVSREAGDSSPRPSDGSSTSTPGPAQRCSGGRVPSLAWRRSSWPITSGSMATACSRRWPTRRSRWPPACIALCDRYEAMTAERPYRLAAVTHPGVVDPRRGRRRADGADRAARAPARRGRGALSDAALLVRDVGEPARPTRTRGRRRCHPWRCSARPGPRSG